MFEWRIERKTKQRDPRKRKRTKEVHMAAIHRTKANGKGLQLALFENTSEERPREGMKIKKRKLPVGQVLSLYMEKRYREQSTEVEQYAE
mmetsp:Transcript_47071/g.92915  ORF Transcript_47071/g.92915 Transcript_47071/m.92915 type:complete len:90 (-) Transcript_47071:117-386(-)